MITRRVSPALATELAALTPEQRTAALHLGDIVIKAGPGSGKTRTIVARAGYLLQTGEDPFRGVAAITYTRPAAREIRVRLQRMGLNPGHRLVSSTVHAFCLHHVVRPFSVIAGRAPISRGAVLGSADSQSLWQAVFDEARIAENPRKQAATLTAVRRALAGDQPTDQFDDRLVRAAQMYEAKLDEHGQLDFEAMVSRALQVLRTSSRARESLVARFPHLIVDEYQDLGPVLHQIVLEMRSCGAVISAVGDEDQTIFGFTGSDPKFLRSLAEDHGFREVRLGTNFRSDTSIVAASLAALGEARQFGSAEGAEVGLVERRHVTGAYDEHARVVVEEVAASIGVGVPEHEIAVLYPRAGSLLRSVADALRSAGIDLRFEKDTRLPGGPLSDLVQSCAVRLLATAAVPTVVARADAPAHAELHSMWENLRTQAGLPALEPLDARTILYQVTDGHAPVDPIESAGPWLTRLTQALGLEWIADHSADGSDKEGLMAFQRKADDLQLRDLAALAPVPGKVVLTNYHQAKGREFDVVVLPGLVEREVPMWDWDREPSRAKVAAALREFYVAMTRPRHRLVLISGDWYVDYRGRPVRSRPSRFLPNTQPI